MNRFPFFLIAIIILLIDQEMAADKDRVETNKRLKTMNQNLKVNIYFTT